MAAVQEATRQRKATEGRRRCWFKGGHRVWLGPIGLGLSSGKRGQTDWVPKGGLCSLARKSGLCALGEEKVFVWAED